VGIAHIAVRWLHQFPYRKMAGGCFIRRNEGNGMKGKRGRATAIFKRVKSMKKSPPTVALICGSRERISGETINFPICKMKEK